MRILVCHNFYQQPGGEDQVFAEEVALLRRFGHEIATFEMDNDAVDGMGKAALLAATVWNRATYRVMRERVRRERAEIVHFHNTFPLISPAAYYAARAGGAAVVQTLHNYRLLCPGANLFRDGQACEKCVGKCMPWAGVAHKCYRGNRAASAAVAAMLTTHRALGTWANAVDAYLAPTNFARRKFAAGGLPESRIIVKPNFVDPDPGTGAGDGGYAVFVARLSHEKGLETLLEAFARLGGAVPLKIIGDGPLAPLVEQALKLTPNIEWLGRQPSAQVYQVIGRAAALIFPSRCYETFGRVAAEAYAKGTPVIASNHGAPADIVREGRTGFLFTPGDSNSLATTVERLFADPSVLTALRPAARREYEVKYTGVANHEMLMAAYRQAMARREAPVARCAPGKTAVFSKLAVGATDLK